MRASCASGKIAGQVALDLNKEEDNFGDADCPMAVVARTGEIVLLQMDGHLTEEEFQRACAYVAALGQRTTPSHNEVVLMSGSLGFSTLICLLNNGNNGQTETSANLLGPFWRMNSPRTESGGTIVRSPTPGPLARSSRCPSPMPRPARGGTRTRSASAW